MAESKSEKSLKPKTKSKVASKKEAIKKKHKIKTMHLSPTDNNAILSQHDYAPDEDGNTPPSTTHALGDMDQLKDHLDEHLGSQMGAESGGEPAPAAPEAAPAAPMGGGGQGGM
jgi:hypothetical protein